MLVEPIKDLGKLAEQYVSMDIKTSEEVMKEIIKDNMICEVKRMFENIKIYNFETSLYSGSEDVKCRLDFSTSYKDADELRRAIDTMYDPDIADAVAYGMSNCLCKPGARKSGRYPWSDKATHGYIYSFKPKQVIFNGPATIVLWRDGTKTIVKRREGEEDDREKAIMYCIIKKLCGNKAEMDKYLKLFLKEESNNEEKA